jgi:hypothetical protein
MTSPYFSVVIPTKNRPERLRDAVTGVLRQSFGDFEIVVCDNSDDELSPATADAAAQLDDRRIRYVRASGRLSMPDNWEYALAKARGEFVGVLTDRSVYVPHALETAASEIEKTGAKGVGWFNDRFLEGELRRRRTTLRRHRLTAETALSYFLNGHPKYTTKIVPKLMTGMYARSVLDQIRDSVGRCCPPVAPDFTSGFLILTQCDWVLLLDEALYVSCGSGNGQSFRRRGELGERFRRDLGMTYEEMVDRMPSSACFAHALVLNDLMRLRDQVPDRFPPLELNHVQYYVGCLNDYMKTMRHGVLRDDDLDELLRALECEPEDVQVRVKRSKQYRRVTTPSTVEKGPKAQIAAEPPRRFDTVLDALVWDEENPREPVAERVLDLMPGVDTTEVPARKEKGPAPSSKRRTPIWRRVASRARAG